MPSSLPTLDDFNARMSACDRCERLREHCINIATVRRRAYAEWEYWGRPVPGFGDPAARVLVVGLARSGDADAKELDEWVHASRAKRQHIEKDVMSDTFLKYKAAEAGEVDWRPTETLPEDYYAL